MSSLRFSNYRAITARFDSTGTCGHAIAKGDAIGYARVGRGHSATSCATCWAKWSAENAEADQQEAAFTGYGEQYEDGGYAGGYR